MRYIIFTSFLFLCISSSAQKYTLSGYIKDAKTGESLIGAYLYTENESIGVSSNNYGFYSLTLPKGTHQLKLSYLGYKKLNRTIVLKKDTNIDFTIIPVSIDIETIDVKAEALHRKLESAQMGNFTLNSVQIRDLAPPLFGEVDLLKSIQKMPGIQFGKEGSSDLFIRGGNSGENLILLDGVPVYYTAHMLGMLSIFNTDVVKRVNVIKGGFPARYGGRLSSIVDIRLKEGAKDSLKGALDLGIISSKFMLEGPINSKSSFIISGRITPLSYLALLAEKLTTKEVNSYDFYDFTAKINYQLSRKDKLYLSLYTGRDKYLTRFGNTDNTLTDYESSFNLNWGNKLGLMRYNHQFGKKMFLNLSLLYSTYHMQSKNKITGIDLWKNDTVNYKKETTYGSSLTDIGAILNMDYQVSSNYFLKFGAQIMQKNFNPNAIEFDNLQKLNGTTIQDSILYNNQNITVYDTKAYIENQIKIFKRLHINLGIHFNRFITPDSFYLSFEPRAAFSFLLNHQFSLKASYARMTQNIHLLGNSGLGFPTDIWVPSTKKIQPESSDQYSLGIYSQWKDFWEFSIESYYKNFNRVVDFSQGTNFLQNGTETDLLKEAGTNWQDRILSGKGNSYGLEFFVRKEGEKWQFSTAYTLSWSWRQFDKLNKGQKFPFRYNREHVLNINTSYHLNKKISITAAWQYMSGYYISLPLQKYVSGFWEDRNYQQSDVNVILSSNVKNNFKTPDYHRLDIGVSYTKDKKKGTAIWNVGIYNVYNRKNPFAIIPVGSDYATIQQISLFPFLPSISYRFIFTLQKDKKQ